MNLAENRNNSDTLIKKTVFSSIFLSNFSSNKVEVIIDSRQVSMLPIQTILAKKTYHHLKVQAAHLREPTKTPDHLIFLQKFTHHTIECETHIFLGSIFSKRFSLEKVSW